MAVIPTAAKQKAPRTQIRGARQNRLRSLLGGRRLDGPLGEDLEQVLLVFLGALEVRLDVHAVRALRAGTTELRATQKWKDHTAVVLISQDGRTFSIRNENSTNLLQQGDMIHRAYNERIHALENAIEGRLAQRA
jgi:hypothetical protein